MSGYYDRFNVNYKAKDEDWWDQLCKQHKTKNHWKKREKKKVEKEDSEEDESQR